MGFEVKNGSEESVYKHDFGAQDFEHENFKTESLILSMQYGDIRMTEWLFDGIRMSYSESDFKHPVILDWKGNIEMVTMHFNLQGKVSIIDSNLPRTFVVSTNEHNMFYCKETESKMKVDELHLKMFLVQFSKSSFLNIAKEGNDAIKKFTDNVESGKAVAFSDRNLHIDFAMQTCINAVLKCTYSNAIKRMFFLSKAIELLVLQAESFNKQYASPYLKKDYDKERILFAKDYLLKNMDSPPSLTELSRIAGINEFKLKRGFKETFNQSVFEYLSDVRLELAKNDLLDGRKSITEIAFELGYSSLQHFSSAFKKKFGVSPGKVRT